MPLILAADTSTATSTVALTTETALLGEITLACQRLHAENLISTVDWLLRQQELTLDDIDLFAVAHGPGSFTGVRIGVATWKGLAFGKRKPLIGVSTLSAVARQFEATQPALLGVLLDARMKEVFGALYHVGPESQRQSVMQESVAPIEAFLEQAQQSRLPAVFTGDGAALYSGKIRQVMPQARILDTRLAHPRAVAVALEAFSLLQAGALPEGAGLAPIYLRQSQAEQHRARQNAGAAARP